MMAPSVCQYIITAFVEYLLFVIKNILQYVGRQCVGNRSLLSLSLSVAVNDVHGHQFLVSLLRFS